MEQAHTLPLQTETEKKTAQTHTMPNGEEIEVIKVLYCNSYGGFGISQEAELHLKELGFSDSWGRRDQEVIAALEKFGLKKASSQYCKLAIAHIPAEMAQFMHISEYDGLEEISISYKRAFVSLLEKIMKKNPTYDINLISWLSSETYVNIKPEKELYERYLHLQKNFRVF